MKRILLCLVSVFFVFVVACQSNKDSSLHRLRINLGSEPQSLDPRKVRDINSISLASSLFEGLFRISSTGVPVLGLAEKVETLENGTKYLFHLRRTYWSDGKALTAYDFAYSWKAALEPSFGAPFTSFLYVVKNAKQIKEGKLSTSYLGVCVKDPYTLEVELEHPVANFFELLAIPIFFPVPKHIVEKFPSWAENTSHYVCCGPFFLQKWKHQDSLLLKKNLTYWEASSVRLLEIQCFMVSASTEYAMFESQELDWAGSPFSTLPIEILQKAKEENLLHIEPFLGTYFVRVNLQSNKCSPSVRNALYTSIDREGLVKHILQGNQAPAQGLIPPSMRVSEKNELCSRCIEGLKESLLQIQQPLTLLYVNEQRSHLVAQSLQEGWKERLHVPIQLEAVERKVFYDRVSKGQYELAMGSWIADFNDPMNFLEVFKYKDNGMNQTFWENAEYIDLLNAAELCKDENVRSVILQKAHLILMEEKPILPLYHPTLNYLKRKKVRNVYVSSLGRIDFKWAYIEEEK
ncbi:MAG: peptide ABC transporter substrate-binding protein [Chlamydiota bacterium]